MKLATPNALCRSLLAGDGLAWHGRLARVPNLKGRRPVPRNRLQAGSYPKPGVAR